MTTSRIPTGIARARRRILGTLAPAALGCVVGYYYGEWFGDPEEAARIGLPGMYASIGAVVGILLVRLSTLVGMILRDFLGRD
jgi:uncharacterized membrane protein YccC